VLEKYKGKNMKKKIILAVASIAIIMLDQISKLIMIDKNINILPQVLSFSYTQNTGVAFGLISNNIIFVIIFNIVILGIIIKFLKENNDNIDYTVLVSLILILSGGIGNLIDRILRGYVVDFIKFDFINFPIFNVADISITLGIFILVIIIVKQMIQNKNDQRIN
jgi:signal peptidase II